MKLSHAFVDAILPDAYAKKASETIHGMAIKSFPFQISDLPEGTKSLAWTFIDYDAVPVCGFPYIHWLVANVPVQMTTIPENFSIEDSHHLEGKNSLVSKFLPEQVKSIDQQYIGPKPPDKDHRYHLTVYALDDVLALENGFFLNHLYDEVAKHQLAKGELILVGEY